MIGDGACETVSLREKTGLLPRAVARAIRRRGTTSEGGGKVSYRGSAGEREDDRQEVGERDPDDADECQEDAPRP